MFAPTEEAAREAPSRERCRGGARGAPRRSGAAASGVLGLAILAACCSGPSGGGAVRVDELVQALNLRQPTRTLALLAPDVVVRLPDASLEGRAAVAGWLRWDSVVGGRRAVDGLTERGDTVLLGRVREANEWLALLGVGELVHEPGGRVVVRGDTIAAIEMGSLTEESRSALDARMAEVLPWTLHEFPDRLRRVRPDGGFAYGARQAAEWMALVREWSGARPGR